jgi:hypothetical protein
MFQRLAKPKHMPGNHRARRADPAKVLQGRPDPIARLDDVVRRTIAALARA